MMAVYFFLKHTKHSECFTLATVSVFQNWLQASYLCMYKELFSRKVLYYTYCTSLCFSKIHTLYSKEELSNILNKIQHFTKEIF